MRGKKLRNTYVDALGPDLYKTTPKAVFAALAVSFAVRLQGEFEGGFPAVKKELVKEWDVLWSNGIIPQPAPDQVDEELDPTPEGPDYKTGWCQCGKGRPKELGVPCSKCGLCIYND